MTNLCEVRHEDLNQRVLIALVVASTLLVGVLVLLCCLCIFRLKKLRNFNKKSQEPLEETAQGHTIGPSFGRFDSLRLGGKRGNVSVFEYHMLEEATSNFHESNKLDEEGSGCVYRACFNENLIASVKRLDGRDQVVERKFENEVDWLSTIQHQNIVTLFGYCIHRESRFLVCEMMQNGSLEMLLYGPSNGSALTWQLRMKIALDVARGLEYLHEYCNPPLIHRDLRSSNILLDSNFNAKLSGFGLALTAGMQNKNVELSGDFGYVAPEYLSDGILTDKSDVYAFGVVLLELLTGRKPGEKMLLAECDSMLTWAVPQLTDRSKLLNIVDPVLRDKMESKHLHQVAAVAVLCVQTEPSYRPLITDVLHSLMPLVPVQLGGSLRVPEGLNHQHS